MSKCATRFVRVFMYVVVYYTNIMRMCVLFEHIYVYVCVRRSGKKSNKVDKSYLHIYICVCVCVCVCVRACVCTCVN